MQHQKIQRGAPTTTVMRGRRSSSKTDKLFGTSSAENYDYLIINKNHSCCPKQYFPAPTFIKTVPKRTTLLHYKALF